MPAGVNRNGAAFQQKLLLDDWAVGPVSGRLAFVCCGENLNVALRNLMEGETIDKIGFDKSPSMASSELE